MATSLTQRILPLVAFFLFAACGSSSNNDVTTDAVPSGNEATSTSTTTVEGRVLDFENFSEVAVESGMRVDIQQGEEFQVDVTGSDEALEELKIEQEGGRLRFFFDEGFLSSLLRDHDIEISIQMPELNELDLSSGAMGDVVMKTPESAFEADVSSGAELQGSISARSIALDLSSGSDVTLGGEAGSLMLDGSSGSHLDLAELSAGEVTADLSSGSSARVMTDGVINADLSSGGHLTYEGNPRLGEIDISSGGTIDRAD